jgi:integrase/recombinase XerD
MTAVAVGAVPVHQVVSDYLKDARARGLAPNTLADYTGALEVTFLWLCERQGIATIDQVNRAVLNEMTTYLLEVGGKKGPLSRSSVRSYAKTFNSLLAFAGRPPADRAQAPKLGRRLVEVLDRSEIADLEQAATTERDRLIIRLLADTGMRASELLGIREDDLEERNRREHYLKVRGKGRKERIVPLQSALYRRLDLYARRGRPQDATSSRIFLGLRRHRRTGDYEPLTLSGLEQMVRWTALRAGITKKVHPHLLRHSFITYAVRRGMSPFQIAAIVGHANLDLINSVYLHLNNSDAHRALMALLTADD